MGPQEWSPAFIRHTDLRASWDTFGGVVPPAPSEAPPFSSLPELVCAGGMIEHLSADLQTCSSPYCLGIKLEPRVS